MPIWSQLFKLSSETFCNEIMCSELISDTLQMFNNGGVISGESFNELKKDIRVIKYEKCIILSIKLLILLTDVQ